MKKFNAFDHSIFHSAVTALGLLTIQGVFAGAPSPATFYTTRSAFYASFPVVSMECFEFGVVFASFAGPLDSGTSTNSGYVTGPMQGGIRYHAGDDLMGFYDDYSSGTFGDSTLLRTYSTNATLQITFPGSNVTAIGFSIYSTFTTNPIAVNHTINGVEEPSIYYIYSGPTGKFLGISYTGRIDSVRLRGFNTDVYIDDVVFAPPMNRINAHPIRSAFESTVGNGLLIEDFEEATPGSLSDIKVSYTNEDAIFQPCDVYRGVEFGGLPFAGLPTNLIATGMAVEGPGGGVYPNTSKILKISSDNAVMGFAFESPAITAVGFNTFVEPSQNNAVTTIFDENGEAVFKCTTVATNTAGGFVGVSITSGAISAATIYPRGSFASIDDLHFAGNPDCDEDGMYDDFERTYFGGATNGLPNVDNDGDKVFNVDEFLADTSPVNSNSYFRISGIAMDETNTVTFTSSDQRSYDLEYTDNPVDQNWTNVAGSIDVPGNAGTTTLEDGAPLPTRTYRVITRLP